MNRRIKKKKQKLEAMHASKYKYAKLGKKRVHTVYIETRHMFWGLIPHEDNYTMYLLRRHRCGKLEPKIIQHEKNEILDADRHFRLRCSHCVHIMCRKRRQCWRTAADLPSGSRRAEAGYMDGV